ncbi:MerR family transcriptional regulator, partial [Parasediminibacterium paludis]
VSKRFKASETGITRRDLSVWHREGLLPFDREGSKWGLYSLVDCIWLRFVQKLKKFGFENDIIIQIKNHSFPSNTVDILQFFKNKISEHNNTSSEALEKGITETIENIAKNPALWEAEVRARDFSMFGKLVMQTILSRSQNVFILTEYDFRVVNLGEPLNEEERINTESCLKEIQRESYVCINLQQLCASFFDNEALKVDNTFYWGIMNDSERQLLNDIRSDKYRLVTVTVADGSITHLRTTKRQKENEEMIKRLSRMFKKGQYVSIEMTTNDGKIIKYDETNVTKF